MSMKLFELKYPVQEHKRESEKRYEAIYSLTIELAMNYQATPRQHSNLINNWKELATFWESHSLAMCNSNLMFEALYHICFRKFSEKAQNPIIMQLILLIEDELLRFGFAFKAWLSTEIFRDAYCEITAPYWENKTFKGKYDDKLYMYLMYRVEKLVMMKNLSREKWTRLFGEFDYSRPYGIWCVYDYVDAYEDAVRFLIPSAASWYEEWSDRSAMVSNIKDLYGVDYSNDIKGLYALINAAKHRRDVATCTRYLHQTKGCSIALLQHLWGADYTEKLQLGFLSICRRYRANRKMNRTSRSRYTYSNFINHWIYKQIDEWRRDETVELREDVRKKFFNVAIGI